VIRHGKSGAATLRIVKGTPPVNKVDIRVLNATTTGLRGGTAAKRPAETIFLINLDIRRDKLRMLLLNDV